MSTVATVPTETITESAAAPAGDTSDTTQSSTATNVSPASAPESSPAPAIHAELERTRQSLAAVTRERAVMRELFALGALDLDIASAVLERDIAGKADAEIPAMAATLKQRRPTLFRCAGGLDSMRVPEPGPSRAPSATMTPNPAGMSPDPEQAAQAARKSNSRTALLHYMRLKREPAD